MVDLRKTGGNGASGSGASLYITAQISYGENADNGGGASLLEHPDPSPGNNIHAPSSGRLFGDLNATQGDMAGATVPSSSSEAMRVYADNLAKAKSGDSKTSFFTGARESYPTGDAPSSSNGYTGSPSSKTMVAGDVRSEKVEAAAVSQAKQTTAAGKSGAARSKSARANKKRGARKRNDTQAGSSSNQKDARRTPTARQTLETPATAVRHPVSRGPGMGPSLSDPQVAGPGVQNNMIAVYPNGYIGPFSNVHPFAIQWPNGVYQNAQGSTSFSAGNTPRSNQTSAQANVVFNTSPHNNALGIQSQAQGYGTAQTAPRYVGPGHMNQPHGSIAEMNQNLQPGIQHYVNTAARMTLNTAREALASRGVHVPSAGLVLQPAPVGAAAFFPQSGGPSGPAGPSGHARPTIVSSSSVAPARVAYDPLSTSKDTPQENMPVWDIVGTHVLPALPTSSPHLRAMTDTPLGLPTLSDAMSEGNFPFMPSYGLSTATCWPVVRILNIPYTTTRGEILAMLGRNARLPKDVEEPVHIIMDKTTSKTQDAFVEFATHESAVKAVERHEDLILKHRQPRLGQRPIEMEMSSQNALCKALFPFAQGVNWKGSMPMIQPAADSADPNAPWTRFRGFMTGEEMALLVRFVEVPHRSPFARDCPQRPYECMISTLKKFPWFMPEHITVMQRHQIYDGVCKLLICLRRTIESRSGIASPTSSNNNGESGKHANWIQHTQLNEQLLRRLFTAAMVCPGFSLVQKDNFSYAAGITDVNLEAYNMPRYADSWNSLHVTSPKPGIPVDILEFYVAMIREETTRTVLNSTDAAQDRVRSRIAQSDDRGYFGYLWLELNLPPQRDLATWTLQQLGDHEMIIIRKVLSRALGSAQQGSRAY